MLTWGAVSLSATLTVMESGPEISNSRRLSRVRVRALSAMSLRSSGGVIARVAVASPAPKSMVEGTVTSSPGKLPSRNPPGSSRVMPTWSPSAVLLVRVRVKVTVSPSVMLVVSLDSAMVARSSSVIRARCSRVDWLVLTPWLTCTTSAWILSRGSYSESCSVVTVMVWVWSMSRLRMKVLPIVRAGKVRVWTCSVGLVPPGSLRLGSQVRTWTSTGSRA